MPGPPVPPAFNGNNTAGPAIPPPPGAIVPPGLVGPPGMIKRRTAIPTKPLLKPSNPVRSLMWTRIIQKPDSMKGSFWKQIEQLEDIDYNRLERNFATRSSTPQAPIRKSNINSAQTAAKINLDSKKSRGLEIFFKSQNLSFSQMKYIIDKMLIDESISHIISTLDDNFLSVQEAASIENYMATNNKSEDDLLRSEANMYRLYLIPGARESIKFLNFINAQQFTIDNSLGVLQLLLVFLTDIRDNVTIKKILSIILSYGNFLNGNHPKRCQADGFQLQLLNNLTSFKVSNKKDENCSDNLLEMAVKEYLEKFEANPSTLYLNPPYITPSKTSTLRSFSFSKTQSELEIVQKGFLFQKEEMKRIASFRHLEAAVQDKIENLLNSFEEKIEKCWNLFETNSLIVKTLIKDFGDLNIERDDNPEEKLLLIWLDFYVDLDSIFMKITTDLFNKFFKEMEAKLNDHRKNVRSSVRIRQSVGENSLKKRLKRLSISADNISAMHYSKEKL